jgi:hypothetical protein
LPEFVPPECCAFEVADGRAIVRVSGFSVENGDGWSVFPRLTLVVVDGPGDEGFLLRRTDPTGADRAPPGWDEAVEDRGGVWFFVDAREGIFAPLVE